MVTTSNKENGAPRPQPRPRHKQAKEAAVAIAAKKVLKKATTKTATTKMATKTAAKATSQTVTKTVATTAAVKTATKAAKTPKAKQTTTANNSPASLSSADQSSALQAEVNRLQLEVESLRKDKETSQELDPLIPRPSAPDFCLQEAMGLEDDKIKYKHLRRVVRESINISGADPKRTWRNQDFVKLAGIKHIVLEREPFFYQYEEEWPIAEFIRRNLKNVRAYRKHLENEVQVASNISEDGDNQGAENRAEGEDNENEDESMQEGEHAGGGEQNQDTSEGANVPAE
ncbi:hypothetical protein M378DRAFT_14010 [Amanita muscaria Koide BX008]|uniref:Uncharacterized protein n=1 Tax=Amanita muscaria (strain Koide BX008) TaxID=946122 RepID=A0A0C2WV34_AMAMK|nr:hypothetical protein M378DRAFT_14010 [Amanita muscaria Koide BX008]